MYESLATCPDDLLLFLHHVPYTYKLHSGKTVIQSIYDSHYEGAEAVEGYVRQWRSLRGLVDEQRYNDVLAQLEYQAGQAEVWRDAVTTWFAEASGIPDAKGRVGHYPGRFEAESMKLEGYTVRDVTPPEDASGGKAVACPTAVVRRHASNTMALPGWYTLHVEYFDQVGRRLALPLADQRPTHRRMDRIAADRTSAHAARLDSTSSTRRLITGRRAAPRRRNPRLKANPTAAKPPLWITSRLCRRLAQRAACGSSSPRVSVHDIGTLANPQDGNQWKAGSQRLRSAITGQRRRHEDLQRCYLQQAAGWHADSHPPAEPLAPIDSQEVWAAGVTYFRSRTARMAESETAGGGSFYDRVYNAERPELFFKALALSRRRARAAQSASAAIPNGTCPSRNWRW